MLCFNVKFLLKMIIFAIEELQNTKKFLTIVESVSQYMNASESTFRQKSHIYNKIGPN